MILLLTGIATLFVAARIYTCSMILRRRLYFEDWCILATAVLMWATNAFILVTMAWGMGLHRDNLSQEQQIQVKFWYLILTGPGLLAVSLPKLSVVNLRTPRCLSPSTIEPSASGFANHSLSQCAGCSIRCSGTGCSCGLWQSHALFSSSWSRSCLSSVVDQLKLRGTSPYRTRCASMRSPWCIIVSMPLVRLPFRRRWPSNSDKDTAS